MKTSDKFLIGIVVVILLVVVGAFVAVLLRPAPTYRSDDTPEGVAHNYLFALQQKDYARAYGYLAPTLKGYPISVERFTAQVKQSSYSFGDRSGETTLEVQGGRVLPGTDARVEVSVRETRYYGSGGLFSSGQSSSLFTMELERQNGAWKIVDADGYFLSCWKNSAGCR